MHMHMDTHIHTDRQPDKTHTSLPPMDVSMNQPSLHPPSLSAQYPHIPIPHLSLPHTISHPHTHTCTQPGTQAGTGESIDSRTSAIYGHTHIPYPHPFLCLLVGAILVITDECLYEFLQHVAVDRQNRTVVICVCDGMLSTVYVVVAHPIEPLVERIGGLPAHARPVPNHTGTSLRDVDDQTHVLGLARIVLHLLIRRLGVLTQQLGHTAQHQRLPE
mmetsp:Transcript_112/g.375  ORF Transcript_112/g.375 Transcript_112/m.375 type:complete len:217 (-) Transcript_112:1930-2580(-)